MDHVKVVKEAFGSVESGDFEKVDAFLHDDYQLTWASPRPLNKRELLRFVEALKAGFPDFSFNLAGVRPKGDEVAARMHITGTHTHTLDLSFLGISPQLPTGFKVDLPEERLMVGFSGDRIARVQVEPVPGGGLEGLLRQIGASLPEMA